MRNNLNQDLKTFQLHNQRYLLNAMNLKLFSYKPGFFKTREWYEELVSIIALSKKQRSKNPTEYIA